VAKYYNLKNIVDDVKLLVEKHKQINSFGVGDIKDLIALTQVRDGEDNTDKNEPPIYPLLYMVPQPVQRDESYITYNFSIIICDIDNVKNKYIQVDLLSDTLEMAEDVLAQFKYSVTSDEGNYYEKYDVNVPSNIVPFIENYEDKLIGWTLQLQVLVDKPLNRCIAPFNNFNQ